MTEDLIRNMRMCFGTDPGFCDCDKCNYKKGCKDELGLAAADELEKLYNFANSYCIRCDELRTWVPVSERLPNLFDKVIVFGRMKYSFEKDYTFFIDAASYDEPEAERVVDRWITFGDPYEGQQEFEILYWMPLPDKPWKEYLNES